jgi:hypothetical protein
LVHRPLKERAGDAAEAVDRPIAAGFGARQERASAVIQPIVGIEIKARPLKASPLVDHVTTALLLNGSRHGV